MLIGVDVGGTFTDVVAVSESGITTVKVSTDYVQTERGVLAGAKEVGVEGASIFSHASTHGLNAIITRRLPKIGFLTTEGHRDILDAGRTWRPAKDLTNPHWRRSFGDASQPLVPRYLRRGVRERITADGNVLIPLDESQLREQLAVFRECEVQGIAICLLNAYINPEHEQRVRDIVEEEMGGIPCSVSSELSPLAKEYARASTAVVDVFMRIIYGDYTKRLGDGLQQLGFQGELNYANCAAHLLSADIAMQKPFEIVFAGPAAGTNASAHFGSLIDRKNLLCADVGGTSCDISLVANGEPFVNTTFELEHDLIVNALSVEVISIGAGGGSLVTISQVGELKVGPGSAGSDPGPACYGRGGTQPTMTDTCLLMGVVDPGGLAGGRMTLDKKLALEAFEGLDCQLSLDDRVRFAFNIGANNIAEGLTNVAIQHGVDPRDYSIVAFGAAGPMLLPAVLDKFQAAEVIVPPHPGLFSALGLVSSEQTYSDSRSAYRVLDASAAAEIDAVFNEMEEKLRARFQGRHEQPTFVRTFDGRLLGQSWETPFIPIPEGAITAASIDTMIANFHEVYESRFGNQFPGMPVQGVTYRVSTVIPTAKVEYPQIPTRESGKPPVSRTIDLHYLESKPIPVAEYQREDLRQGDTITGPAIVREPMSTTFMLPGQILRVGKFGELYIRRIDA